MATWTVYVSPRACMFCDKAQDLLRARGLAFEAVVSPDIRSVVKDAGSYPQIFDDNDDLVGGFDKLRDKLDEPLLNTSLSRFSPIPVKHLDIWRLYKEAQAVNWVSEEIDYSTDLQDWASLTAQEKHFLKHVLAFFNSADGIVQENLMTNFVIEAQYAEVRQFYAHQAYMESVHSETYGTLLSTYVVDDRERDLLVNAIVTTPSVKRKASWALKWMDSSRSFAERLIAFICVEGIMFSGSFCAIFWMKQRGKLPALTLSNDFISRDEGMHQQFGELLYTRHIRHRLPESCVHVIISEAVDAEIAFVEEAIPIDMKDPHIDRDRMVQYVKYVADRMCQTLGYRVLYGCEQPFAWMESISLRGINNFFEKRSEMYRDAKVRIPGSTGDKPVFSCEEIDF